MNKKTRSVRVTNNPVASASEYKRFIENIYCCLLGLSVNNSTRRFKLDGSFGKGAFDPSICAYDVHKTQNRGSLHHHLILWGSIPPSLLQKASEDENNWDEIAKILESQYQCEIDLKDIEKHVITEYLVEEKDFNHDNFQNPMPFSVPNQESEIVNDEYIKDFLRYALNVLFMIICTSILLLVQSTKMVIATVDLLIPNQWKINRTSSYYI